MERNLGTIVVKIGSSSVTHDEYGLDHAVMRSTARQLSGLFKSGYRVALVSSGAVAAGRKVLGIDRDGDLVDKQEAAIYGQPVLITAWREIFAEFGVRAGQVLLTGYDLDNSRRPLLKAMNRGIPVINANDPVNDVEMRYYEVAEDNDRMSGHVAGLVEADKLIITTDVDGVEDKDGQVIEEINSLDDLRRIKFRIKSAKGTGGMRSKIKVGLRVQKTGCDVWIVKAGDPEAIIKAVGGERIGTYFPGKNYSAFKEEVA